MLLFKNHEEVPFDLDKDKVKDDESITRLWICQGKFFYKKLEPTSKIDNTVVKRS
jgi:hypothetical protein